MELKGLFLGTSSEKDHDKKVDFSTQLQSQYPLNCLIMFQNIFTQVHLFLTPKCTMFLRMACFPITPNIQAMTNPRAKGMPILCENWNIRHSSFVSMVIRLSCSKASNDKILTDLSLPLASFIVHLFWGSFYQADPTLESSNPFHLSSVWFKMISLAWWHLYNTVYSERVQFREFSR